MLGRVLDALDKGPHADDTIVVLWSDHGWHLGEGHWQKFTPLAGLYPRALGHPGPQGNDRLAFGHPTVPLFKAGPTFLALAPTLLDLSGLPASGVHDGPSLVPLLEGKKQLATYVSLTHLHHPGVLA